MRSMWWLCVAACGGGSGATPDAAKADAAVDAVMIDSANGEPSDVYPAFHPPVPQITTTGAPVLANPRIVQVYFADDTEAAVLEDFTSKFAASPEWTAMVGEYGVGTPTVATPVVLTTNTPAVMTDMSTRALLNNQLDGNHPEWGPVDAQTLASTIYLFHIPAGVSYMSGFGTACQDFGGYHSNTKINLMPTQYAMVFSCTPGFVGTQLNQETSVESHELVEAVTDPQPPTGYYGLNDVGMHWGIRTGPEVGDMCMLTRGYWYTPDDLGYMIQRSWSNAAVAGYHEYCLPKLPAETVFFAAIPAQGEPFTVTGPDGAPMTLVGTRTQIGIPTTIALDLVSDGPTGGPFTVEALDDTSLLDNRPVALTFALDRTSGQNGEILHLTITPQSRPASGYAPFTIHGKLGTTDTWWKAVAVIDQ